MLKVLFSSLIKRVLNVVSATVVYITLTCINNMSLVVGENHELALTTDKIKEKYKLAEKAAGGICRLYFKVRKPE